MVLIDFPNTGLGQAVSYREMFKLGRGKLVYKWALLLSMQRKVDEERGKRQRKENPREMYFPLQG